MPRGRVLHRRRSFCTRASAKETMKRLPDSQHVWKGRWTSDQEATCIIMILPAGGEEGIGIVSTVRALAWKKEFAEDATKTSKFINTIRSINSTCAGKSPRAINWRFLFSPSLQDNVVVFSNRKNHFYRLYTPKSYILTWPDTWMYMSLQTRGVYVYSLLLWCWYQHKLYTKLIDFHNSTFNETLLP